MRYILLITLISIFNLAKGQDNINLEVSPKVKILVDSIAYENVLMSSAIGFAAIKPDQYKRFEKLKEIVTVSELQKLTNHQNGVVRCYAFWDLASKDSTSIYKIVVDHLEDNEIVKTQFGCIGGAEGVGDFFLNVVTPNRVDNSVYKLSSVQSKKIDSLLLHSDNKRLYAKHELLSRIAPTEYNYNRIREIAIEENIPQSILALSKFRKQQDVPIIEKLLKGSETEYWGFRCVQYFPDTTFFKYLENWHKQELVRKKTVHGTKIRVFYKALVNYETEVALQMIMESIKETKGFRKQIHHKYIMIALLKYPTWYYEEVKIYLKVNRVDLEEIVWDKTEIEID